MDNHQVQHSQLKGHETVCFNDFRNTVMRVEQLEAKNESLSAAVSSLKDQNRLLEAKLSGLEGKTATFQIESSDKRTHGQISSAEPVTPKRRKIEDDNNDNDDVQSIDAPVAIPDEAHTQLSDSQYLEDEELPTKLTSHGYMKLIRDLDYSTVDVLLIPTFEVMTYEIPIFDDIELDSNLQPRITHKYVVILGETGAHLGTGYRLPSWTHGRGQWVPLHLQEKQAFEGSVLEMKAQIKQTSGRGIKISGSASRRQRQNNPSHSIHQPIEHQALPKYIHELGELFIRSYSHVDDTEEAIRSTGCHLVVEICSKSKALWLVFRYKGVGKDGRFLVRKRKFDRDEDMFQFVQRDQGFDVCQIAESINDWLQGDATLGQVRNAQGLINSTGCRADPNFTTPIFEEFLEELNKDSIPVERSN